MTLTETITVACHSESSYSCGASELINATSQKTIKLKIDFR